MSRPASLAIVDYGMGNLFSVQNACTAVGVPTHIVTDPTALLRAAGVILPGVGAMPDAMSALDVSGLSDALREAAARGTPMLGVCLGLQLLMTEGTEFRRHAGLGIIEGDVVRLEADDVDSGAPLRVPHIGWNAVTKSHAGAWTDTTLEHLADGTPMYFIHSFHVRPAHARDRIADTTYGSRTFCSAAASGSIVACQFHPEKSGLAGIDIYRRFAMRAGVIPDTTEITCA